jgi:hypothetical protein
MANHRLRFSIHNTSTGTIVFQETHSVTTSNLGLFNVNIGSAAHIASLGAVPTRCQVYAGRNGCKAVQLMLIYHTLNSVPYAYMLKSSKIW